MNIKLTDKDKIKVANCDDVYGIMQRILKRENKLDREKEHLWVIGLGHNNLLMFIELISLGTFNMTSLHPPDLFRVAILKNAPKMIICHNHPTGEVQPSDNDKELTDKLIQCGKFLDVEVVEHLIITPTTYYSFVESGLFEALKYSLKWLPSKELRLQLTKEFAVLREMAREEGKTEGIEIGLEQGLKVGKKDGLKEGKIKGREEGERKKAIEMAKKMLAKEMPLEEIMEFTGLSKTEVNGL